MMLKYERNSEPQLGFEPAITLTVDLLSSIPTGALVLPFSSLSIEFVVILDIFVQSWKGQIFLAKH